MSLQPYQTPPTAVVAPGKAKRPGPSPFVKALPLVVNSAFAALAHQWHYQGGAHSIGDALYTCGAAAVALWAGRCLATSKYVIPPVALAVTYGVGGGLIGVAVINYSTAIAAALLAWLSGTVVSYTLAWTGWARRSDQRDERAHELEMTRTKESAKTERTRIKADAQVAVARELSGAWAAEQAARTEFNTRYPSSVPLIEHLHIRPEVRAAWDAEAELRMLTAAPRRERPVDASDGIELPHWLTDARRRDAR